MVSERRKNEIESVNNQSGLFFGLFDLAFCEIVLNEIGNFERIIKKNYKNNYQTIVQTFPFY